MAQQEIRINIAGRYYAMYITPEQEEVVRRIGKNIEMTIKEMENNYATKAEFNLQKKDRELKEADEKLKEVINFLKELEEDNKE